MRFDFAKTFVFVVVSAVLSACGGNAFESTDIPAYRAMQHVIGAPAALTNAVDATVVVSYPGGSGTGFWVTGDGVLVTNHHVLGADATGRGRCAVEGCYVSLLFHYEKGVRHSRENYFLTPIRASRTLDVAAFQVWTDDTKTTKLASPSYLALGNAVTPHTDLSVNVIGHPDAGLKRRSRGNITEVQGTWFKCDNFSLPGSSGSPLVDNGGRIVGILHHSSQGHGHLRAKDIRVFTLAASAQAIAALLDGDASIRATPFASVNGVRPVEIAASMSDLYLLARQKNVRITPRQTAPILPALAAQCDAAIAGPPSGFDDFYKDHQACYDALRWMNCRDPQDGATYKSCPTGVEKSDWQTRFDKIAERGFEAHLEDPYDAAILPATFELDAAERQRVHRQRLDAFLRAHTPKLSPVLALYLIDASVFEPAWRIYDGKNVIDYVKNFQKVPNYPQDYEYFIRSVMALHRDNRLGEGPANHQTLERISRVMLSDPKLSLTDRHLLEEELYLEGR